MPNPSAHSSLDEQLVGRLDELLADDDADRAARYPGTLTRQPVHTVYVPADRFAASTVSDWSAAALGALDEHGPLPVGDDHLAERVRRKLAAEPIEDLRIDFEDGYGTRSDDEEDAVALASAAVVSDNEITRYVGIRMKSLEPATRARGVRTLALFVDACRRLPDGFRITLPKVTSVAQVAAMVTLCAELESAYSLPALRFEIQIEMPQAILGAGGTATVAQLLHAADGRCAGLHYGTYDYSAALGVAAAYQSMEHPVADHAKAVMQVAAAGTGVPVCDGSTNVLPVGTRDEVRAAWALHARLVRRSLERGLYQGWDLHPAQLPTRFAATFAFYADGAKAAVDRLQRYLSRADSGILDEPATARALAGFLVRGIECGALDEPDICARVGVPADRLRALTVAT